MLYFEEKKEKRIVFSKNFQQSLLNLFSERLIISKDSMTSPLQSASINGGSIE